MPITISLILPTLNEAESLPQVLAAVPALPDLEIVVVDGGSQDGTPALAAAAGARVIHEARRGYGRACAAGAAAAQGELLAFLDADGADDPAALPRLLAPLLAGQVDLSLGARLNPQMQPGAMPWHQRFGNRLCAGLIRGLYHVPLTDLSPFRALRRERLAELNLQNMTYGWPTEMLVKALRAGWRVCEQPVPYRRRLGGRSKISGTPRGTALATYHILRLILAYAR